ncbi:hypothetical protein ACLB2K_024688 [Fragaria x ananassa]
MGCSGSKHYSDLSPKRTVTHEKTLMGTTALAFFTKDGQIVVAVDSRASNEVDNDDPHGRALKIVDNEVKTHRISGNIVAVQVGNRNDCEQLMDHIDQIFPYYLVEGDVEPRVSDVAETAYEYLKGFRGQNKGFGILLAGWDAEGDNQIYRLFIADDHVVKQEVSSLFGVLGSGHFHAATVLKDMFSCDDIELALKALFRATFFDKASGGFLRVFIVGERGVRPQPLLDPLEAYSRYYELYDGEKTLFLLVVSSPAMPVVPARKLVKHFREENITVLAAHCVAHRQWGQHHLSFHRLVFSSRAGASTAYTLATAHYDTDPQLIISEFPKRLLLTTVDSSVKLYLSRSSKDLLQSIRMQFDGYLTETRTQ